MNPDLLAIASLRRSASFIVGFLRIRPYFAVGDAGGDLFLAGHAVARPRHGIQPLGGNRLFALQADAVVAVIHAVQRVGNLAQQLHVDGVAVEEDPLFVVLLAEIAFVGRDVQPGDHLGRFLGGHAATDFLRLLLQNLAVELRSSVS